MIHAVVVHAATGGLAEFTARVHETASSLSNRARAESSAMAEKEAIKKTLSSRNSGGVPLSMPLALGAAPTAAQEAR